MKSSVRLRAKVESVAKGEGVAVSMPREDRRRRGTLVERNVGREACRKVIGAREGGTRREGRARREGRRARGGEVVGVSISLLRRG